MMLIDELKEKVQDCVVTILVGSEFDFVHLRVKRRNRDFLIEVFVDKPRGGITLQQCAELNKIIIHKIDEANLVAGNYFLEVCSPGIDWPMKTEKDFLRALNRRVRVHLNEPVDHQFEFEGSIQTVSQEGVMVGMKQGVMAIPFSNIRKGIQVV